MGQLFIINVWAMAGMGSAHRDIDNLLGIFR